MRSFSKRKGSILDTIFWLCNWLLFLIQRTVFFCYLYQSFSYTSLVYNLIHFSLAIENCYLLVWLMSMNQMIFCYLVWPCISMYLVILNGVLHTLFHYCYWYLVSKSIVSFEHMISCPSYNLLSYPIVPNTLIIHNLLSYQAPLVYNHKGFLGVITNWRRCQGEEIEAQLPWETTRSNFDDRQRLGTFSVVIIYLVTPWRTDSVVTPQ